MIRKLALISILILLSSCDSPPCPTEEGIKQAAKTYEDCIKHWNVNDGGLYCGRRAYKTFCEK